MKEIRCRDLGFDCEGVVRAETEESLLKQVAAHAESVHHLQVTPEIVVEVKKQIRDV